MAFDSSVHAAHIGPGLAELCQIRSSMAKFRSKSAHGPNLANVGREGQIRLIPERLAATFSLVLREKVTVVYGRRDFQRFRLVCARILRACSPLPPGACHLPTRPPLPPLAPPSPCLFPPLSLSPLPLGNGELPNSQHSRSKSHLADCGRDVADISRKAVEIGRSLARADQVQGDIGRRRPGPPRTWSSSGRCRDRYIRGQDRGLSLPNIGHLLTDSMPISTDAGPILWPDSVRMGPKFGADFVDRLGADLGQWRRRAPRIGLRSRRPRGGETRSRRTRARARFDRLGGPQVGHPCPTRIQSN